MCDGVPGEAREFLVLVVDIHVGNPRCGQVYTVVDRLPTSTSQHTLTSVYGYLQLGRRPALT